MRMAEHEVGARRVGVGDSLAAWDEAVQIGCEEQRDATTVDEISSRPPASMIISSP